MFDLVGPGGRTRRPVGPVLQGYALTTAEVGVEVVDPITTVEDSAAEQVRVFVARGTAERAAVHHVRLIDETW